MTTRCDDLDIGPNRAALVSKRKLQIRWMRRRSIWQRTNITSNIKCRSLMLENIIMHVMLQFVNYLLILLRVASNSSCKKPVNYRYRLKESKDTTLHERQCFINIHHLKMILRQPTANTWSRNFRYFCRDKGKPFRLPGLQSDVSRGKKKHIEARSSSLQTAKTIA